MASVIVAIIYFEVLFKMAVGQEDIIRGMVYDGVGLV